jgi:hypothetical protein
VVEVAEEVVEEEEGEAHGQLFLFCSLLISLAEFIFMRKGR